MFLRVKVKGILSDLESCTSPHMAPPPLLQFLNNICQKGAVIPNNFLTPYQLNRIYVDNYGCIIQIDESQIKMISSKFIFSQILVKSILLKGKKIKEQDEERSLKINGKFLKINENMKTIASIIYFLYMNLIHEMMIEY